MRVAPLLLVSALGMPAQQADLLPRIRAKMAGILMRQPDYTCTETVERTRQPIGSHSKIEDTLRLEVALVDGKEMFAWPGSKQFEDRDLSELVSSGMFGNGNFAIYARLLFLSNVVFEDRGETELNGHLARRYDFRVSRLTSGHRLRIDGREAVVGFHGSFYADPVTLDVSRLHVEAEDIPADLGVSAAETTVDLARIRIGDDDFLLPVESQLMMAMPDAIDRNSVRFSSCRKFTGESTLLFDDPLLTEAAAVKTEEVEIPAKLTLEIETPQVELAKAAIGDPVRAILRKELKSDGQVLAPKGSIASGRIVRLDRLPNYFVLQIQFRDLDWQGGHAHLNLRLQGIALPGRMMGLQPDGAIAISRQAGPRLSGILMFWRSE